MMIRDLALDARVHLIVLALAVGVGWQLRDRLRPGPAASMTPSGLVEQYAMHVDICTRRRCPHCFEARRVFRARAEASEAPAADWALAGAP